MMQCEIIRDLLPLYAEGLTGEETIRAVEAHLATCEACAKALEQLRAPVEQPEPRAEAWQAAMKKDRNSRRRRLLLAVVLALLLGAGICLGILYRQDFFDIRARKAAPQGGYTAIMYQGSRAFTAPGQAEGFRIRLNKDGKAQRETVYNDAEYLGMNWSPDGRFLAVNYRHQGTVTLSILDTLGESQKTFAFTLKYAVQYTPTLSWVRWQGDTPLLDCSFVTWNGDSTGILVSARGADADGAIRQGYFWYHPAGKKLSITGLTDFDTMTREEQAVEWSERVQQFLTWGKDYDVTFGAVTISSYRVLAELLARRDQDCIITYYQYREETEDFALCDPDTALERLRESSGDYTFAAFAQGEVLSSALGDMICETLYIVVFE